MNQINFKKHAWQYAEANTDAEKQSLDVILKAELDTYLNETDETILKAKFKDLYAQILDGVKEVHNLLDEKLAKETSKV